MRIIMIFYIYIISIMERFRTLYLNKLLNIPLTTKQIELDKNIDYLTDIFNNSTIVKAIHSHMYFYNHKCYFVYYLKEDILFIANDIIEVDTILTKEIVKYVTQFKKVIISSNSVKKYTEMYRQYLETILSK